MPLTLEINKLIKAPLRPFSFAAPPQLSKTASSFEVRFGSEGTIPPAQFLEVLLQKVRRFLNNQSSEKFTTREIKNIPFILYYGRKPQVVDRPEDLTKILSLMARQTATLRRLIRAYLLYYDSLLPGNETLRGFIQNALIEYEGRSPRMQRWKSNAYLFEKNGPYMLAGKVAINSAETVRTIESAGFQTELRRGKFMGMATKNFFEMQNIHLPTQIKCLKPLLEDASNPAVCLHPEILSPVADAVIKRAGPNCEKAIQDQIRPIFLRYLGDPRLAANRTKWSGVSEDARKVFRQWISRQDLDLFFKVVQKTAVDRMWRYRQRFWETYIPHIENSWVVLGSNAQWHIKDCLGESIEEREFASLVGGSSDQSVFILEMKGYIFTEWSHSGKFRAWNKMNLPFQMGRTVYSSAELKRQAPYELIHSNSDSYSWQYRLKEWITYNCHISPADSYYLR